jgi:outer membrane murein-binding lipoprotein Lpp
METVGQEVGKIETRLRQLGAKLDRLVAKVDEVGTDAKADYRSSLDHARDKQALVQSRLDAYKAANGQKWESFKGGVETAWRELADAYKAIKQ